MSAHSASTLVSIILPTYNRAAFLDEAFSSVLSQQHNRWELIVVDDGSTDDTPAQLERLARACANPVRVVRQPNAGAYAARNTGLDHAQGELVAFYDSDDLWLPHHLSRSVQALADHPDVHWVYGACRMVTMNSGDVLEPSTFHPGGRPRPFLSLRCLTDGDLRIIEDPRTTAVQIRHGLYCGLQNSVIRRSIFEGRRFWPDYFVVEDELFVIRLLAEGKRFAYFDAPHVVYRVHDQNSSGSADGVNAPRSVRIFTEMVRGLERVRSETPLSARERRALTRRLAKERFWGLGYSGFWLGGDVRRARACYRQSLREWPWSPRMWKTYLLSTFRGSVTAAASASGTRS